MPKRKMSTFERLQKGQLKRGERRELAQRIDKGDQCAFKRLRHGIERGKSRHRGNRCRQRKPFRGRVTGPKRPTGSGIRVVDRCADEDVGLAETAQNPHECAFNWSVTNGQVISFQHGLSRKNRG